MTASTTSSNAMDRIKWAFVTVGGLGHLRPAPGTWGSIPPVAIAGGMIYFGASSLVYYGTLAVMLVVFSLACMAWGRWAEQRFNRKDPRFVVADEVAGQCIALCFAPAVAEPQTMDGMLTIAAFCGASFLLFRIFDIIKPPPAHSLQRLKGGAGILIDDLLAGLYALLVLQVGLHFLL